MFSTDGPPGSCGAPRFNAKIELLNMNNPGKESAKLALHTQDPSHKDYKLMRERQEAQQHAALRLQLGGSKRADRQSGTDLSVQLKFSPDPMVGQINSIYLCNLQTNLWEFVTNADIEQHIQDLYASLDLNLRGWSSPGSCATGSSWTSKTATWTCWPRATGSSRPTSRASHSGHCARRIASASPRAGPTRPKKPGRSSRDTACAGALPSTGAASHRGAAHGSCGLLSGRRIAKRFMVTDKHDGNNGNSAFADLVKAFFGDNYSSDQGAKFVMRAAVERGGRSDHGAGSQGYKGCG